MAARRDDRKNDLTLLELSVRYSPKSLEKTKNKNVKFYVNTNCTSWRHDASWFKARNCPTVTSEEPAASVVKTVIFSMDFGTGSQTIIAFPVSEKNAL